ncbi:MAG: hypothetical protein J5765_03695 [Clostridia bacterium]|nr:hypothetical protein [Clostridia bacterium]
MEEKEQLKAETALPTEDVTETSSTAVEAPVADASTEQKGANDKKGDKPMTKKKKILNGILLGVQILLVVVALILTIAMIMNPKQGEVSSAGLKLLPVLSDSMDGEREIDGVVYKGFPAGALVFATGPHAEDDYEVGDVITFEFMKDGERELNTHRIVKVEIVDGVRKYRTQGDNPNAPLDSTLKVAGSVQAVYSFHINKLGYALTWVRSGYNFIYVIIIPLGLLLLYNIYLVAQIVIEGRMKKANAVAAEQAKQAALASIDEEEIKRRAIEEYLKSQAAAKDDTPHDGESE